MCLGRAVEKAERMRAKAAKRYSKKCEKRIRRWSLYQWQYRLEAVYGYVSIDTPAGIVQSPVCVVTKGQ